MLFRTLPLPPLLLHHLLLFLVLLLPTNLTEGREQTRNLESCFPDELPRAPDPNFSKDIAKFSLKLFKSLVKTADAKVENTVVSPYSVWSALVMAYLSAEGRTKNEIARALHLHTKIGTHADWMFLERELTGRRSFRHNPSTSTNNKNERRKARQTSTTTSQSSSESFSQSSSSSSSNSQSLGDSVTTVSINSQGRVEQCVTDSTGYTRCTVDDQLIQPQSSTSTDTQLGSSSTNSNTEASNSGSSSTTTCTNGVCSTTSSSSGGGAKETEMCTTDQTGVMVCVTETCATDIAGVETCTTETCTTDVAGTETCVAGRSDLSTKEIERLARSLHETSVSRKSETPVKFTTDVEETTVLPEAPRNTTNKTCTTDSKGTKTCTIETCIDDETGNLNCTTEETTTLANVQEVKQTEKIAINKEQEVKQTETTDLKNEQEIKQTETTSLMNEQEVKQTDTKALNNEQEVKQTGTIALKNEHEVKHTETYLKNEQEVKQTVTTALTNEQEVRQTETTVLKNKQESPAETSTHEIEKEGKSQLTGHSFTSKNWVYVSKNLRLKSCLPATLPEITAIDFSRATLAAQTINGEVKRATEGVINNMVEPRDLAGAELLLLNAVHFKGEWVTQFPLENTKKEEFFSSPPPAPASGSVDMMQVVGKFKYAATTPLTASALLLPYSSSSSSSSFSLLLLLPERAEVMVDSVVERLTFKRLQEVMEKMAENDVEVSLPKFSLNIHHSDSIKQALSDVGVSQLFSTPLNFTPLTPAPLRLHAVIQQAAIQVDEQGTTFAAATGLIGTRLGPVKIKFNRPFVFLLYDSNHGIPLAAGVYRKPAGP